MAGSTSHEDEIDPDLPNPPIPEPSGPSGPSGPGAQGHASHQLENPFDSLAIPNTTRVKQIWAVGGGKGGVGKSLMSASLGISLARQGRRVIAVDLDLGGANLHTALGVGLPKKTLSDFLSGRTSQLQDCVSPTHISNLQIISGAQDAVGVANLTNQDKVRLMQDLQELEADYVILDLGAGTHHNTIDFFLYSDLGMILILPEPTSIENAYRFIKNAYFRRLLICPHLKEVRGLIEAATDTKNPQGLRTPPDLYQEIRKSFPEAGLRMREEIEKFQLKLVVNQARTQTDIDIGFSVKSVCRKYFGINMDYIGCLDYDSAAWQAVRRKRALMLEFPNSQLVSSFERISNYLVKRYGQVRSSMY